VHETTDAKSVIFSSNTADCAGTTRPVRGAALTPSIIFSNATAVYGNWLTDAATT
jgi:hypothetical protein